MNDLASVSTPTIPIGHVGRILDGPTMVNWFVKVEADAEDAGGYFILQWTAEQSFDDWVRNLEELNLYFLDKGWNIRWSAKPVSGQPTDAVA